MTQVSSTVLKTGPAQFNQCGQFLSYPLSNTDENISHGLVKRLHSYAVSRLDDAGFKKLAEDWNVEVYTMDADDKPADRSYCVKFKNTAGGYIEVVGILTNHGWPSLDHGYEIGCE